MTQRFAKKDLPRIPYWVLVVLVVLGRLLVAWSQRVYLTTDSAPLDDMLMIRAAMSITEGEWLGAYGAFAIAKNMGYAVWLALLHTLHIPVLLGQAALWLGVSAFAVKAMRPLLPGNLSRLCLLAFFAFNPYSYAFFNQRVYRDSIFPAFCLLLFAGVMGLALRLNQPRLRGSALMALGAGVGLAGGWLLREDGAILLIFGVVALFLVLLFALLGKGGLRRIAKGLLALVPVATLGAGVLLFSLANYNRYGVFTVNDLTSGSFPSAYGAMVGVSRAQSGFTGKTPVSSEALASLLREVPALQPLEEHLTNGPAFNGFANKETGEYGGSFYYGLRLAADLAGQTPDAETAQAYWQTVAQQIDAAVAEGRLHSAGTKASVAPRLHSGLFGATAKETAVNAAVLLTYDMSHDQYDTIFPQRSSGPEVEEVAAYLYSPVQTGYVAGTEDNYYSLPQRLVLSVCGALPSLYAIATWALLGVAALRTLRGFFAGVGLLVRRKKGLQPVLLLSCLVIGLVASFAARVLVAGYMEVASFGIGTYNMYLASAVPALLLAGIVGVLLPLPKAGKVLHRLRPLAVNKKNRKDLRFGWLLAIGAVLVVAKLVLASAQNVYLALGTAPIDDDLMLRMAASITEGNWLGSYDWLILSKHSFFALWLSWLHGLGIPFLLGGQLLYTAASLAGAWAFAPLFRRRWACLATFGLLLFNPASTANPQGLGFVTRVYRDNIFPALCLLCIAGMVGFALRWRAGLRRSVWWLVLAGFAFGGAWLCREDGWWLLPFVVAATVVCAIFVLGTEVPLKTRITRIAALLLPFAILGGCLAGWAGTNQKHYGVFTVSDFSSGAFARAYGAMTRIEHESWEPKVAVPEDVRVQLYAHVPELAEFQIYLESPFYKSRYAGEDYSSGAFYWALREAAAELGYYESPGKAEALWDSVADTINALCDEGTFVAATGERESVSPPIKAAYIGPVLREGAGNLWFTATFQDCDPRSQLSINDPERNLPVEQYLKETALVSAVEGSSQPYYGPFRSIFFRVLDILRDAYAVLVPLMLLCALWAQGGGLVRMVRRFKKKAVRNSSETMVWFIGLGLLACILLRAVMIAYVNVSSFGIGTYVMYLASIHPILILYAVGGTYMLWRWAVKRRAAQGVAVEEVPVPSPVMDKEKPVKREEKTAKPRTKETKQRQPKAKKAKDGRYVYKPGGGS